MTNDLTQQLFVSVCYADIDLVFVLDASNSVKSANFEIMKNFIKKMLSSADIDGGSVRVGINVFSDKSKVAFNLNTYDNKNDVFGAIDAISYTRGSSYLPGALKTVRTQMFTTANGDRAGVRNIAVIVTDGVSQGDPMQSAGEARREGIHIFAIGIGSNLDTVQLEGIANKPADMFLIEDFDALAAIERNVFETVCGKFKN